LVEGPPTAPSKNVGAQGRRAEDDRGPFPPVGIGVVVAYEFIRRRSRPISFRSEP